MNIPLVNFAVTSMEADYRAYAKTRRGLEYYLENALYVLTQNWTE